MRHTRGKWAFAAALGALLAATACLTTTDLGNCRGAIPTHAYTLGDSTGDTLTSQACRQHYQFTVTGQANVQFKVVSPGLQTFLQLYDQRGAIVMNSAYSGALDTATVVRMMLGDGNYTLAVNVVTAGQSGPFRLTSDPDTSAVAGCGTIWVTTGITTTQTITPQDCTQGPLGAGYLTHVYAVVLLQNQVVTVAESAAAFTPEVFLYGQGTALSSTLDSTGTKGSLSTIVVTQGGYNIWAGSSSPGQTGKYTLQIQ
jgi:hypothetical protein